MNDDRWQKIISMVEDKFAPCDLNEEEFKIGPDKHNNPVVGKIERIEFKGPLGRMKLERTTKPKVLNKKTLYSKRAGSDMRVDYEYSPDETVQFMKAYRWNDDGWIEINTDSFT